MTERVDTVNQVNAVDRSVEVFYRLSKMLIAGDCEDLLKVLPVKVCDLLSVPVCILWRPDENKSTLRPFAIYDKAGGEYGAMEIAIAHPSVRLLFSKDDVLSLSDVGSSPVRIAELEAIKQRQWVSLMSVPLATHGQPFGMLDVFSRKTRHFQQYEKNIFKTLANYATLALQTIHTQREREEIRADKEQLQELMNIMTEMTDAPDSKVVWRLMYDAVFKLVDSPSHVAIGKLNPDASIETVISTDGSVHFPDIKTSSSESGITGKAIKDEAPVIANNVLSEIWKGIYVSRWEDTRSEMSIPLIAPDALIREGSEVKTGPRRIGILNVESIAADSFNENQESRLQLLAHHTALKIEKLDFHDKLMGIRAVETEISHEQNHRKIIETVVKGIADVLGFTWVNISLIDPNRTTIRSEYVHGLEPAQEEKFKEMSAHGLKSKDIQASVVKNRTIEVPDVNDSRLDKEIFKQFGHENLCRVFMPMIEPSSDRVIGTVEAGYQRDYRPHIYEKDIQLLQGFVDYAVSALEHKKSIMIDRIAHEIKSPIVGIRGHASFLQRRFTDYDVSTQSIGVKLGDILTDCELLLFQTRQIEYFLGKSLSEKPRFESVPVLRDIVIKTVNQLKPVLNERNFDHKKIIYRFGEAHKKISVNTDPIMLNQVVYNLLMNALKYSKKDADDFKIIIEAEKTRDTFIVKFKDWGIGIEEEYTEEIFKESFRTPAATKKEVGLGLGLSISSSIMKQLHGDLELVRFYEPTEFHLRLPLNN